MTGSAGVSAPPHRRALLLSCGAFDDPDLPALRSPTRDARALNQVLTRFGYEVTAVADCGVQDARRAVAVFLDAARRTGVNLIYFSCHGIQDTEGSLYFAFRDTQHDMPDVTAVAAEFVRHRIGISRSRSTIVIIDCCFSGAFLHGMRAKSGSGRDAGVDALVRDLPEGSGVAVLTSSGATEVSLEDPGNRDEAARRGSYFTEGVLTGLVTGAADRDGDGRITVDELFSYASDRVADGPSHQKPRKFVHAVGDMVVALVGTRTPEPPPPAPPPTDSDTMLLARDDDKLPPWPPLPPAAIGSAPGSPSPARAAVPPVPSPAQAAVPSPAQAAVPSPAQAAMPPPARAAVLSPPSRADATTAFLPRLYGSKPRARRPAPILVAAAAVLLLAGTAYLVTRPENDPGAAGAATVPSAGSPVRMPSLVGLPPVEAERAIRSAGLTPTVLPAPNANVSCVGETVIVQSPAVGGTVRAGVTVGYAVCPPATVPKLVGKSESAARRALADAALRPMAGAPKTSGCTRGEVAGQTPAAGSVVGRASTVVYTVCERPSSTPTGSVDGDPEQTDRDLVEVPCTIGKGQEVAQALLQEAGLDPQVTVTDAEQPPGEVIDQVPGCGAEVDAGIPVLLVVSEGPEPTPSPSLPPNW
jgi:beta-lactam-binding protein with PASTA domain